MDIFSMGASPRGTIALLRMAKAMAVIYGRDYVTAQDVQSCVKDVLGHRIKISARGKAQKIGTEQAVAMLLNQVPAPRN
jgi:MoxR-like ATPase